ncbi:hypothetical protein [Treponema sp. R80B11-R83G3]
MAFSCCNREKKVNVVSENVSQNNYLHIQTVHSSEVIGKQIFDNLKTLNSSVLFDNVKDGDSLHSSCYMEEEERLYLDMKWKAPQYGLFDWNNIEFLDYHYNDFQIKERKYINGCLIVKIKSKMQHFVVCLLRNTRPTLSAMFCSSKYFCACENASLFSPLVSCNS